MDIDTIRTSSKFVMIKSNYPNVQASNNTFLFFSKPTWEQTMNVNPKHKYNHRLEQYNQYSYNDKPNILHKFKGFNISRFSFAPFSVIVDVEVLCNKIKQTNLKGEAPFTLTFGSCWERKEKEIGKGIYLSFVNWLVGALPPTKQIKVGLASWDTTIISVLETHLYFHFLASLAATSTTSFLLSIMSKSSGGNSMKCLLHELFIGMMNCTRAIKNPRTTLKVALPLISQGCQSTMENNF